MQRVVPHELRVQLDVRSPQLRLDDGRRRPRFVQRVRPGVAHHGLSHPAVVVARHDLEPLRRGRALRARDDHLVTAAIIEPHGRQIDGDVGGEVAAGVVDLIQQLLAQRVEADAAPGPRRLGDEGHAVGRHLGDGVADAGQVGNRVPVALEVPSAGLARALEQMPDDDALSQLVQVRGRPAERVDERGQKERGVRHAAGDDDVGVGLKGLDDRPGAQVSVGEEQAIAHSRQVGPGVQMSEGHTRRREFIQPIVERIARHGRHPGLHARFFQRRDDRGLGAQWIQPAGVQNELHAARQPQRQQLGQHRHEVACIAGFRVL
ncbi:hypothetical protein D3C72_450970 [compost metagenome]